MLRAADLGVGPQAIEVDGVVDAHRHRVKCVPVSATTGTRFCVRHVDPQFYPTSHHRRSPIRFSACAARRATDSCCVGSVLLVSGSSSEGRLSEVTEPPDSMTGRIQIGAVSSARKRVCPDADIRTIRRIRKSVARRAAHAENRSANSMM